MTEPSHPSHFYSTISNSNLLITIVLKHPVKDVTDVIHHFLHFLIESDNEEAHPCHNKIKFISHSNKVKFAFKFNSFYFQTKQTALRYEEDGATLQRRQRNLTTLRSQTQHTDLQALKRHKAETVQ